ncbi:hypothetical protein O0Q50_22060 [Priestia aryabhattai]|uniref:Uncharacterized protein n=1 Tax=Priestia aryabhattai TaxID=412384 RepID=A0AAX6ND99_PRIAR|nr:hypothetical protein [Priestia aryabhattai]MDU9693868.1 hypothetical protein [Priestia aryabhattai]
MSTLAFKEDTQLLFNFEDKEVFGPWIQTHNCDEAGRKLADRHYSRQTIGAARFTRPGKNLVLRTAEGDAVWATWYGKFRRDGLDACECTIFRNESSHLSSYLISFACLASFLHAGVGNLKDGIITYVDDSKVNSVNPGFSFRAVGFKYIGRTKKNNLMIFQLKRKALEKYFSTIDLNEEYKQYFEESIRLAAVAVELGEVEEAIDIFTIAMAFERSLIELYRYAKSKLKMNLAAKRDFKFVPSLEDFLEQVYGEWCPVEEFERWEAEIDTHKGFISPVI